jgi:hypothetical protein
MIMHKKADGFLAEFSGTTGAPRDLQPGPNMDVITDFIKKVPNKLDIP